MMNQIWKNYGGLILFYGVIVIGVILLNERFRYLNEMNQYKIEENIIAYQELEGGM